MDARYARAFSIKRASYASRCAARFAANARTDRCVTRGCLAIVSRPQRTNREEKDYATLASASTGHMVAAPLYLPSLLARVHVLCTSRSRVFIYYALPLFQRSGTGAWITLRELDGHLSLALPPLGREFEKGIYDGV